MKWGLEIQDLSFYVCVFGWYPVSCLLIIKTHLEQLQIERNKSNFDALYLCIWNLTNRKRKG